MLAARYVATFDRSRRLYLTYYSDGDTRRRGATLAGLKSVYREHGWQPPQDELPDFLPLLLKFAARSLAQTGARTLSHLPYGLAAAVYAVLLTATALKVTYHFDGVRGELSDPVRLFGHFTLVVASGVLAARLGAGPARAEAWGLLGVAAVVRPVLALAAVRGVARGGTLRQAEGSWFLATVDLRSLVLTAVAVRPDRRVLVALVLWAVGVLLYAATLAVVAGRLLRHPPGPVGLAPTYWVTKGATAISALAGARPPGHVRLVPPAVRAPLGDATVPL